VELVFEGGKKIMLGTPDASYVPYMSFARAPPAVIEIRGISEDVNGKHRYIGAFDNQNTGIDGCQFFSPCYNDSEIRRISIRADHDLVGVSCITD
jgi:hypothetical protein